MNIHVCQLDRECRRDLRSFGTMRGMLRVYINTKKWHFSIALAPGSRMGHIDGRPRWTYFSKKL